MSGTEDIDAVLEEWQGSKKAMRWAPDMDEEAIDGDHYSPTGVEDAASGSHYRNWRGLLQRWLGRFGSTTRSRTARRSSGS